MKPEAACAPNPATTCKPLRSICNHWGLAGHTPHEAKLVKPCQREPSEAGAVAQEVSLSAESWPPLPGNASQDLLMADIHSSPKIGVHFGPGVSHMVTATALRHHFQRCDQDKEWNCWVWEGSDIRRQRRVSAGGFFLYPAFYSPRQSKLLCTGKETAPGGQTLDAGWWVLPVPSVPVVQERMAYQKTCGCRSQWLRIFMACGDVLNLCSSRELNAAVINITFGGDDVGHLTTPA